MNGISCSAYPSTSCDTTLGLSCQSNLCSCSSNYYWSGATNGCLVKGTYGSSCTSNVQCSSTQNLICTSSGSACNCPTNYALGSCDCTSGSTYYDSGSSSCVSLKSTGSYCPGIY